VDAFRKPGGLPSHPTVDISGISANTGSLGMGLSKALGFALGQDRHVYCLLGDGEMMEGQNWEAALAIGNLGIKNITVVVDYNAFSQDGPVPFSPFKLERMFEAAGWNSFYMTHRHDYYDLQDALGAVSLIRQPSAIILQTTKGKGASFEGTWQSHAGPPRDDYSVTHPLYKKFGEVVERVLETYPKTILDRVFDFGIAEQNIISFASARALMGQIPIVATYACFLRRGFEQIYNQITEGTQVLYIGSMAGPLEEGGPGISHESLDDAEYMGRLMLAAELRPVHYLLLDYWLDISIKTNESAYLRLIHHG